MHYFVEAGQKGHFYLRFGAKADKIILEICHYHNNITQEVFKISEYDFRF